MIREALDRAKAQTLEVRILNLRRLELLESRAAATLLGRLTPHPKETWARVTQLREARAGRRGVDGWLWQCRREQAADDSSSEGCSDFLASASRALQLEQAESQKRLPRESCSCTGLSAKLHRARLERLRALGSHTRSSCLLEAGEGPTAVTTLSERWAIVEAKAAAISTLGVADTFSA